VIDGSGGADQISGFGSNDSICGSTGNDAISSGPDHERFLDEDGNDLVRDGGGGTDTAAPYEARISIP
jgi:Ca2+-binding RTX toxin-like protein